MYAMRRSEIPARVAMRDCDLIGDHRQRLAVKISAAENFSGAFGKYQRIIGGAI